MSINTIDSNILQTTAEIVYQARSRFAVIHTVMLTLNGLSGSVDLRIAGYDAKFDPHHEEIEIDV